MQRLGCLFVVILAACGGGTATGEATLSGVDVKASAVETFVGGDSSGTKVMGWNILLYEQEAGGDCLEGTVLAKVAIYTNQAEGSAPQALLQTGGISIVTEAPPTIIANAVANMTAEGAGSVTGLVNITTFHLTPDAKHADRIVGTISATGFNSAEEGVALNGAFDAPICTEE